MDWAIEADKLVKRYGDFTAVDHIDFAAPRNICFGMLGPNGAGKTTTIRMISCRFEPDGGTLRVLGMDVREKRRAVKSRLGLVPQENNLDEDLTLLQNLELYGRYFGLPYPEVKKRSLELLDFMQLSAKMNEPVSALSGGMQRRAMIARALINRPELIVLDEPTTGLDPQARVLLWDRLRELKSQGVTLLLTTHYMDEAQRLCDELLIMHEGKILDRGAPAELVERHVGKFAAEIHLPAHHAVEEGRIKAQLPGGLRHVELSGRSLHVYAADDAAIKAAIDRVEHEAYYLRPANLEDVFLVRTGREINE